MVNFSEWLSKITKCSVNILQMTSNAIKKPSKKLSACAIHNSSVYSVKLKTFNHVSQTLHNLIFTQVAQVKTQLTTCIVCKDMHLACSLTFQMSTLLRFTWTARYTHLHPSQIIRILQILLTLRLGIGIEIEWVSHNFLPLIQSYSRAQVAASHLS